MFVLFSIFFRAFTYMIHNFLGVILHSMCSVYKIPLVSVYKTILVVKLCFSVFPFSVWHRILHPQLWIQQQITKLRYDFVLTWLKSCNTT